MTDLAVRYLSKAQVAELERPVVERATKLVATLRDEFLKEGFAVDTDVQMGHVIDTCRDGAARSWLSRETRLPGGRHAWPPPV